MSTKKTGRRFFSRTLFAFIASLMVLGPACQSAGGGAAGYQLPPPPQLPVITITNHTFSSYQEFPASLEGSRDIEIRPQVNGYLDKIYVDEGAAVKKGQPLFQVNDQPYKEALNNAKAALASAKANEAAAAINVSKLTPLVEHNVISAVQLKTAQAALDAAQASVAQAEAMVANASINIGYSLIRAPSDGYIGRIHFKTGSLVGLSTIEPLTILSEVKDVRAYFSLTENDFLHFKNQFAGKTIDEKLKQLPPVELILADNSVYPQKGKIEVVSGQFTNGTGGIPFRASFPNTDGSLRSGNTGRIRIPKTDSGGLVIPQESTFELQDKVFVFVLGDSNKVVSTPVTVSAKSGNFYLISQGIKPGEKIVYTGLGRLRDGQEIVPTPMAFDSLFSVNPK
jgi:membrane fusion protein, multidrug efflux system